MRALWPNGQRNTDAVVMTEASCLVLRYPEAHTRITCEFAHCENRTLTTRRTCSGSLTVMTDDGAAVEQSAASATLSDHRP